MKTQELARLFGTNVRFQRVQRNWTQADLAARSQLNRSYLAGIESGSRNVRLSTIASLATALDVEPVILFADRHETAP